MKMYEKFKIPMESHKKALFATIELFLWVIKEGRQLYFFFFFTVNHRCLTKKIIISFAISRKNCMKSLSISMKPPPILLDRLCCLR